MTAPSGTNFKAFSGVEGFVKVTNMTATFTLLKTLTFSAEPQNQLLEMPLNEYFRA
ncbi:MAG: hypothetical protein OXE99_05145 [Cellvibrionales bacterium]|nr:hypothetical protein [Cellvibrionales bacterium]